MIRELQNQTGNQPGRGYVWRIARVDSSARGQSLVEMTLITPLLLLMFLGVIEVGWALRGYLVLVNADREATRFAARAAYLDFSQPNIEDVGYQFVLQHTLDSVSGQLPLEFTSGEPNATMIITHMAIDTGYPCSEAERPCDDECRANPDTTYPDDDVVRLPAPIGGPYASPPGVTLLISDTFRALYGIGGPAHTTRITDDRWEALWADNEALNCQRMAMCPSRWPAASSQFATPGSCSARTSVNEPSSAWTAPSQVRPEKRCR